MRNVQSIVDTGRCIGCAACFGACARGHILTVRDGGFGFPVPHVDGCEGCGACLRRCPSSDWFEEDE